MMMTMIRFGKKPSSHFSFLFCSFKCLVWQKVVALIPFICWCGSFSKHHPDPIIWISISHFTCLIFYFRHFQFSTIIVQICFVKKVIFKFLPPLFQVLSYIWPHVLKIHLNSRGTWIPLEFECAMCHHAPIFFFYNC